MALPREARTENRSSLSQDGFYESWLEVVTESKAKDIQSDGDGFYFLLFLLSFLDFSAMFIS